MAAAGRVWLAGWPAAVPVRVDPSNAQASAHRTAGRWIRRAVSIVASWPNWSPAGCAAGELVEPHAGPVWSTAGLRLVAPRRRPAAPRWFRPDLDRPAAPCAAT